MADYMETTVSGRKWRRCYSVAISNPYNMIPSIVFQEEDIIQLPGGRNISTQAGPLTDGFDSERMIVLLDPATGEPTGQSVPEGLVYQVLFSKYMALAKSRDEASNSMRIPLMYPQPVQEPQVPAEPEIEAPVDEQPEQPAPSEQPSDTGVENAP